MSVNYTIITFISRQFQYLPFVNDSKLFQKVKQFEMFLADGVCQEYKMEYISKYPIPRYFKCQILQKYPLSVV